MDTPNADADKLLPCPPLAEDSGDKQYEITLRSGGDGEKNIRTRASSVEAAMTQVCDAEGVSRKAVVTWRVVPTSRQLAKTKSLMRGL